MMGTSDKRLCSGFTVHGTSRTVTGYSFLELEIVSGNNLKVNMNYTGSYVDFQNSLSVQ
jgi:hypothetical protein